MSDKGYQQAIERLAYEMTTRIHGQLREAIESGDFSRWDAWDDDVDKITDDPIIGEDMSRLEEIFWVIHKQYGVPKEQIQQDLTEAGDAMMLRLMQKDLEKLWDDL